MKVSSHKSAEQLKLFDYPLYEGDHGYARHVVGETIEQLSAIVLGGFRHSTNSQADYCPDISVKKPDGPGLIYYECKAAGLSRQTFIYAGRLKKDRRFNKQTCGRLFYLIWHHKAYTKDARSVDELRSLLLQRIQCAYIVPFQAIDAICESLNEEKLNSAYGQSKQSDLKVYGSGFRLPLKSIESYKAIEWRLA